MTSPAGLRPTGLLHPHSWYVTEYGMPLQTIRNYVKRKWPLDDPQALFLRISGNKRKKPPLQKLLNIVNGQSGPSTPSPRSSRITPKPKADVPPVDPPPQVIGELKAGLADELKRLEMECAQSYANYANAAEAGDKILLQKVYLANVNALRALAKDAPKADRDAKNVVPVTEVDSTWSRALKEFKSAIEMLGRRLSTSPVLKGKDIDPVDVEETVNKEVFMILERLESGSWLIKDTDEPS